MNAEENAKFARVQEVARSLADAVATDKPSAWQPVKEFSFTAAYQIIYDIAMRPLPSSGVHQQNLYGTGEELYLKFQQLLAELVRRHPVDPTLSQEQLFAAVIRKWQNFLIIERWMLKAFQYITRFYVPHLSKPPLSFLSLVIFNQEVFKKYSGTVSAVLLSDIQKLRAGENVAQDRMKDAVRLLLKMGFGDRMSPEFVKALSTSTADYYRQESKRCVECHNPVEYTRRITSWLANEAQLASWLLPDHSMQLQFLGEVEREAVAQHLGYIIDSPDGGFISLLRQNRLQDLKLMLQVMVRPHANGVPRMAELLKRECIQEGERLIQKYEVLLTPDKVPATSAGLSDLINARMYCEEFIKLHEKFTDLVTTCLLHSQFQLAVKQAFETTVNAGVKINIQHQPAAAPAASSNGEDGSAAPAASSSASSPSSVTATPATESLVVSSSELIARYSDQLLCGGTQFHLSDNELEEKIKEIVALFTRITDKEDFFDCLRGSLSRRLLANTTNDDRERMFLAKFRQKCGASATNKLEGMLHDVDASRAVLESYCITCERRASPLQPSVSASSDLLDAAPAAAAAAAAVPAAAAAASPNGESADPSIEFAPLLLTQAFWPAMADEVLVVPRCIKLHEEAFFKHYCIGRHHRQVKWVYHYGSAVLTANVTAITGTALAAASTSSSSSSLAQVELMTTPYQAAVIMCFNETPVLRVEQLAQMTQLTLEEVSRHVHSFASARVGSVLLIDTAAEQGGQESGGGGGGMKIPLNDTQTVRINSSYHPTQRKMRVPLIVPRAGTAAAAAAAGMGMASNSTHSLMMGTATSSAAGMGTPASSAPPGSGIVGGDKAAGDTKQPAIEAVIMKIMKSRQRMNHETLVMLVTDNLKNRFLPDVKFIKKVIEGLLHRELIARDSSAPDSYVFHTA